MFFTCKSDPAILFQNPNPKTDSFNILILLKSKMLGYMSGVGTCGPRGHLIWPASEFLLPRLEYKIASKRSSVISSYLDSTLREVTLPHS